VTLVVRAMKFSKNFNVTPENLSSTLPKRFHSYLSQIPSASGYDILVFPPDKVISSKHYKKVQSNLNPNNLLVLCGSTFTQDLIELTPNNAFVIQERSWYWTDESHNKIKQSL
jgi:hypothetical protein